MPGLSSGVVPPGMPIDICVAAPNTGTTTIKVNGTSYPLWGNVGALQGGEIGAAKGIIRVIMNYAGTTFFLVGQNTGGSLQCSPGVAFNHAVSLIQIGIPCSANNSANSVTSLSTSFSFIAPSNGYFLVISNAEGNGTINGLSTICAGATSVVNNLNYYIGLGVSNSLVKVAKGVSSTVIFTATQASAAYMDVNMTGIFIPSVY
jgi:hypothetical protein